MTPSDQPRNTDDTLLDEEISDDEANEEIDIPIAAFTPSSPAGPKPTPAPPQPRVMAADDTTPSVKEAIDKAADILRELRGER